MAGIYGQGVSLGLRLVELDSRTMETKPLAPLAAVTIHSPSYDIMTNIFSNYLSLAGSWKRQTNRVRAYRPAYGDSVESPSPVLGHVCVA
jgi:hypothetical protein